MIGLEYICGLYKKSYNSLAEELGISRQSINGWIKGLRKIPQKHIPRLSEIFNGIPQEYFQKKLTDMEKIDIQKIKVLNEVKKIEYEDSVTDETGKQITVTKTYTDLSEIMSLELQRNEIMLLGKISNQMKEHSELIEIYEKLEKVIRYGGINIDTINYILDGMINYEHDFMGKPKFENDFTKAITKLIKEKEDK